MTKLKSGIIFAFAALLMALPFASSNTYGDGAANLDADCPVNFPASVDVGSFAIGVEDAEVVLTAMSTGGTKAGTLEIDAQDWVGDGLPADGSVTFFGVGLTDIVVVNALTYTGVAGAPADNTEFTADGGDASAATTLATSIDSRDATLDGTAAVNTVLIVTVADGDTAETLSTTDAPRVVVSGATLTGGEATGVIHMAAEVTRFLITTDGTPPTPGSAYSAKLSLNSDAAGNLVVAGTTDITQDVNMIFQITGIGTLTNLPYSGPLSQDLIATVTCVA